MNIISLAFRLSEAVAALKIRAKELYYAVMLMGHACPGCGHGLRLVMVAEGRCRCRACGREFDPTVAFQRCSACGGMPELRIRRYRCGQCGAGIASHFLFDGLVFDVEYFRRRMAESRHRKRERRERVQKMLAESRSLALEMPAADSLEGIPGLVDALNSLTREPWSGGTIPSQGGFDLRRYQSHIQAHIRDFPIRLREIPPLGEVLRKDLIWRFIAVIFMAHSGHVDIWQNGGMIMVVKHETDTEGQGVPGDLEGIDGIERSLGGIEA